ncbi:NAD-dependent epimerase/dehydratase family protein [Roseibacterium beibuensis]|uniref:NAD-dependent epimerase/dehydratase family protein n=1 Tax=[Roseibacterium] beibuensis TaxID=1193142 RepID=UPI00217E3171|nr:NAD-dependent epimerase/dehydratase family protein [Roseibacterium beibuensis]MCS6627374.1 NAD-dependent epimerase/dehydratase family protein [Roseibacterium beibuensis]
MSRSAGPILVTGATGFLGRALVERLASDGHEVRAGVRRDPGGWPGGVSPVVVGDLSGSTDWSVALAGVDCVVHCAARAHVLNETAADPLAEFRRVNTDGAIALGRQAAKAGVRRLIFISSIGVNGAETHGRPFTAADAPAPHSPYAVSKLEAEQGLAAVAAATGLEVATIRPPLVTGPDPKGNLATLRRAIRRGLPLPFGLVTGNRRDLVSLDVLCDLIETCIRQPAAAGRTFLVSDGAPVSTRRLLEDIGAMEGRKPRLLPVPPSLLSMLLGALGKASLRSQLLGDLEVDIAATRGTLGWTPSPRAASFRRTGE